MKAERKGRTEDTQEGEDKTEALLVQWILKGFGNSDPPS